MKQLHRKIVAAAVLALAPAVLAQTTQPVATTAAADANKVVLRVGEATMTAGEYAELVNDVVPEQSRPMAMGPMKRMFADQIVEMKVLSAEAVKRGLDKDPKVMRQMAMIREQVLAMAVREALQKNVDEASLKKYFEDNKGDFEQVKARHILIRSGTGEEPADATGTKILKDADAKKKAEEISARLKKGEDFAAVAKAESQDPGSAMRGGDLGFFGRQRMVPEFEKAAFGLKVNEISEPVKTPYGYHIIQVQEHNAPDFEKSREEIVERMAPDKVDKAMEELKKSYKVEVDESFFGKPMPAGMPGLQ